MKTLKRVFSAAAALVLAVGMTVTAFADDEKKKDDKKEYKFEYDESRLTDKNEPALSFDGSGFEDYIHLTRDADKAGIAFKKINTGCYQGNSLKITAKTETGVEGYFPMSVLDNSDENAPDIKDTGKYSVVGIEFHAKDFGLSYFDGCFINFTFKMTEEDENALLNNSIYVYGADKNSMRLTDKYTQLKFDKAANDTVTGYNTTSGTIGVPVNCGAEKLIIDMPVNAALDGDVLFLDNITVKLPSSAGDKQYIKNIDNYNPTAKKNDKGTEIIVKEGNGDQEENSVAEATLSSKEKSPVFRVVITIIAIIVVGTAILLFVRSHKKYY